MYYGLLRLGFTDADFILQDDSDGKGAYLAEWNSDKPQPSASEIQTANDEWQSEHNSQEYARKRKKEYPTIAELVVALYDTDDKADIDRRRAEVKAQYPKP